MPTDLERQSPCPPLTPFELKIVQRLATGARPQAVAKDLGIKLGRMIVIVRVLQQKFEAASIAELAQKLAPFRLH